MRPLRPLLMTEEPWPGSLILPSGTMRSRWPEACRSLAGAPDPIRSGRNALTRSSRTCTPPATRRGQRGPEPGIRPRSRGQRFSLCPGEEQTNPLLSLRGAIATPGPSPRACAATLFIPLPGIASSLPLLAMTTGAMTTGAMTTGAMTTGLMLVCHRYSENCCPAAVRLAQAVTCCGHDDWHSRDGSTPRGIARAMGHLR
jgi:hypothetical protein